MARAFAITREYLGTRSRFGKPIAANQVVQHRLVDVCGDRRSSFTHADD
jgi:butyryl-CoA dehydrogenase